MMRIYKYVFYKLYRFEVLLFDPAPEFTALGLLVVTQGMNLYLLLGIAEWYFARPLLPPLSPITVLCAMFLLAVPQYLFFVHKRRFKRIAHEFAGEALRQSVIGGVAIFVYVVASLVLALWIVTLPR